MSYIANHLLDNERIIFQTTRHWVIFLFPGVLFLIGLILFSVHSSLQLLALLFLSIAIALWVGSLTTYLTSEYAVTNMRVVMKWGFLNVSTYELLLRQVSAIYAEQTITGRLLNYGTVIISTTGNQRENFVGIADPFQFRRAVQELIQNSLNPHDSQSPPAAV